MLAGAGAGVADLLTHQSAWVIFLNVWTVVGGAYAAATWHRIGPAWAAFVNERLCRKIHNRRSGP